MAEERRMNFYQTFYDLTTLLPERERQKVNTALLDYFYKGVEPQGLSDNGMKVFMGCKGRISKSRTNASNVASRYAESNDTNCPTEADTNCPTESATNTPTKPLPERERDREKDREGGREKRARFRAPAPAEVAEYARGYAEAKGIPLGSFDADHFCDYYAAQGWRLSNGNPMRDWQASVRKWLRDEKRKEAPRDEYSNL